MSFNLESRLKKAQKAFASRQFTDARQLFRQVLEKFPKNARAKRGYLLSQSAIADASFASTHPQMQQLDHIAGLLSRGGMEDAAKQAYALASRFPDAHALFNILGVAAAGTGREEDAIKAFKRAVFLKPNFMEARANLANRMMARSDFETALLVIEESLALVADDAMSLNAMTVCLIGMERFEDAVEAGRRAVKASPDNPEAHNNLGICYRRLREWDAAAQCYARALKLNPDFADALSNLGLVQVKRGEVLEGVDLYKKSLALQANMASTHGNLGLAYLELRRFDDAIRHFDTAIDIDPNFVDAEFNKFVALALGGRLAEAWPHAEIRFDPRRSVPVELRYRGDAARWDGRAPLTERTLLVHAEQGIGDTIMFFRYLKSLQDMAQTVLVAVQGQLTPWLAGQQGDGLKVISLEAASDGEQMTIDYQCPLMSLPHLLGDKRLSCESPDPYLSAPADFVDAWRARLGDTGRPRVGFAFRGNPDHQNDHNRSMDLDSFLSALPNGADYHFLGIDPRPDELTSMAARPDIHNHADEQHDFRDAAALVALMDHVVTVDTSMAHLAGALGVETSILLAHTPDWRWGVESTQSNWYRSVRLFRQGAPGDWAGPTAELASALRDFYAR